MSEDLKATYNSEVIWPTRNCPVLGGAIRVTSFCRVRKYEAPNGGGTDESWSNGGCQVSISVPYDPADKDQMSWKGSIGYEVSASELSTLKAIVTSAKGISGKSVSRRLQDGKRKYIRFEQTKDALMMKIGIGLIVDGDAEGSITVGGDQLQVQSEVSAALTYRNENGKEVTAKLVDFQNLIVGNLSATYSPTTPMLIKIGRNSGAVIPEPMVGSGDFDRGLEESGFGGTEDEDTIPF